MKILIDIVHPADVNFYKNAVEKLSKQGNKISFTVMRRGRLPKIMKKEFSGYKQYLLGKHRKTFLGKIWSIKIREIGFFFHFLKHKYDVVTCFGFYPGFWARIFGMRAIHFHDDKEYKLQYFLSKLFATRFISLCKTKTSKKVKYVKSFKEIAYLHPSNYKEDKSILKKLKIKKYCYIRDVENISLNYSDQKIMNLQPVIDYVQSKGYSVLYHPEQEKSIYKNVKLLKGSFITKEMNAIKKHASLIITSGDTVLREGALLGTPTIYVGKRIMSINKPLEEYFSHARSEHDCLNLTKKMLGKRNDTKKLMSDFKNMTKIIIEELTSNKED